MSKSDTFFLFWVTILAVFVSITGLLDSVDQTTRIFQILFIPVSVYLVFSFIGHLITRTSVFDKNSIWKRLLIYYCFIVTSSLVTISFLSSRTVAHIISSLLFSPLAIYFLLLVWPRPKFALVVSGSSQDDAKADYKETSEGSSELDVDRRDFLKLIGSAGMLAFIFSLFSKRGVPFFAGVSDSGTSSLKDSGGNTINPAEKSPTDGYYISEVDDAGTVSYFGFINKENHWFIMRQDTDDSFRYVKGDNDFASSWSNRDNLNYDYFANVF